jgi:hypothetical protein
MNTGTKMVVIGCLAVLVVALSSGSLSTTQVKALSDASEKQKQECMQLRHKMPNDENTALNYRAEECKRIIDDTP